MSNSDDDIDQSEGSFWGQLDNDTPAEPVDWAGDELEAAYLRAMEALEASDAQFPEIPPHEEPVGEVEEVSSDEVQQPPIVAVESLDRIPPAEFSAELTELNAQAAERQSSSQVPAANVTPRQIMEALLFVGGEPLTTRKLVNVLRGEFSAEFVETQLADLNSQYAREGRPYEIRLGDGGYRLVLREDFERIRRKTYGLGPKEVKLSQEAIEVLAVIAYHQPLTAADVEKLGKTGASGMIRQLLRRELIVVERAPDRPREVMYRTTPRFLSLFGLRNLNELPRMEQVVYK